MQDLWKSKVGWDDEVSQELSDKWNDFQTDLSAITELNIPRQAVFSENRKIELHGFCDASEKAYAACLYVRCVMLSGEVRSNVLCAKSRVAPIKKVSLPRLELCGAVLLANLTNKVISILNVNFHEYFHWTDSMITLAWIQGSPNKWKTFVANRVGEIQTVTNIANWYHVGSADNPADLLSRGVPAEVLNNSDLWWHGPGWFKENNSMWDLKLKTNIDGDIPEQKTISCVTTEKEGNILMHLTCRYSSLMKLQRVVAYVLRFISNLKIKNKADRQFKALLPQELDNALNSLIKEVQKIGLPQDYNNLKNKKELKKNSSILSLNPFMQDGLLRVGGRLRNAQQEYDKRFPIILPKDNELTTLILRHEHLRLLHCGVQALLCSLRDKYWPISGRNSCKKIINKCVTCFKAKPRGNTYLMGDLPEVRVNNYLPFVNVGIDYGGPFLTKDRKTRGAKLLKSYVCLFVCMGTRAIHLELVSELTTEAFIAALKRFVSRRGKPNNIFSDNGSNFIGANNELSKISEFLNDSNEVVSNYLANDRIR